MKTTVTTNDRSGYTLVREHGEPWECLFCEKLLPRQDHLKYHLNLCIFRQTSQNGIPEFRLPGILKSLFSYALLLISLAFSVPQIPFGSGLHNTPEIGNNSNAIQRETFTSSANVEVQLLDGTVTLLPLNVENGELR